MSSVEHVYMHSAEYSTKTINRDGQPEEIDLLSMRCSVNRSRKIGDEWDNSKSFWINVDLWGGKVKHMKGKIVPGMEAIIIGRYEDNKWTDRETGEEKSSLKFVAEDIAITPYCVEQISYKTRGSNDDVADQQAENS